MIPLSQLISAEEVEKKLKKIRNGRDISCFDLVSIDNLNSAGIVNLSIPIKS